MRTTTISNNQRQAQGTMEKQAQEQHRQHLSKEQKDNKNNKRNSDKEHEQ
jgi:hypothetical protein